ncbi:response regulator [Edaphobacter aggregans]|uniref:response regulator n=1 Tax=Edaphobacter aggregans TaxID=570835 RepID=UPI000A8961E3|nr:response regulator [Edaphobacter aggregans]
MNRIVHSQIVPLKDVPLDDSEVREGQRRLDVLVVDDEPVIADTLAMILSKSGYRTKSAYAGKSALELAREHRPRLLITDVIMPGMTGIDLALTVERVVPSCKVLLFSGQAATVDLLVKAREMGRDYTIVSKPIHPADMIKRVAEYVQPVEDRVAVIN